MGFLDLIFFAALAVFLGYRLWTLLGTHDAERPIKKKSRDDLVFTTRSRPKPDLRETVLQDTPSPTSKENDQFLKGAKLAFRQIVEAYANENLPLLRKLVKGPLLETFEEAIEKRTQEKKTLEVDIGSIAAATILENREEKGNAYVTVRFVSQQSLLIRAANGKLLEGDPDRYSEVTDIWTFSRPLKSSNPNWFLIATQLPEASASPPSKET